MMWLFNTRKVPRKPLNLIEEDIKQKNRTLSTSFREAPRHEPRGVSDLYKGLDYDLRPILSELLEQEGFEPTHTPFVHCMNGSIFDGLDDNLVLRLSLMSQMGKTWCVPVVMTSRELVVTPDLQVLLVFVTGRQSHAMYDMMPVARQLMKTDMRVQIPLGTCDRMDRVYHAWARLDLYPSMLLRD